MAVGGLDDFDVDQASLNLANVGQQYAPLPGFEQPVTPAPGADLYAGMPPELTPAGGADPAPAPAVPEPAAPPAPNNGQPGANSPPPNADALAPMTPEQTTTAQFQPLPAPPAPPALTGNPQMDAAQNLAYQRQLTDWHTTANAHRAELSKAVADLQSKQTDREAAELKRQDDLAAVERKRWEAERTTRQGAIDEAVKGHAGAAKELEGFKWNKPHTGGQIVALIAGAIGQGFMNAARIQSGHAPDAQNEAMVAINKTMEREYQQKQDRLKNASEALLQARYGFKDSQENHRAAMNDLDAENAAKWRLISKEGEQRLRRLGATQAQIDANVLVANARENAAKAEMQIHQREEGMQVAREHNAANENIARATLGQRVLSERDAHADRVASRLDRKEAREETRADKNAKAQEKEDTTAVRDDDGKVIGHVPTGKGGAQGFATRDADYGRAEEQLQALLEHVKKHGERALSPQQIKEREALYNNALGGVVTVSPMGKTNEAQEVEKHSIGASGGISLMGANTAALERKIEELRKQRERYRTQTLIPVEGAEKPAPKKTEAKGAGKYGFLDDLLEEGQ